MELTNTFDVAATPDVVWQTVGDMRQVALCLPGAVIESQDGDTYRGRVQVKVGPISMGLGGTATVVSRDDAERRMEVRILAEDLHGQGTVEATMVVSAVPAGAATTVTIVTAMQLGGKVAQFGSGLVTQVSGRIVRQVAKRMGALVEAAQTTAPMGDRAPAPPTPGRTSAGRTAARPRTAAAAHLAAVALAGAVFGWSLGRSLQPAR
ncbi:SRPBCC family protein [Georgenia sp. SYP-B2076]|uniref:SRPBCC family protein n=1 Tax=Georgenia sp. SYP-B2076 TaxID=2495881 RepID=UPI000F8ED813|nr:SRPBCC family protein [Georgenia sp. SYP-B2076]